MATSMHYGQEYMKSILTSHEISDRDKGANMLCFIIYMRNSLCASVQALYIIEYVQYLF